MGNACLGVCDPCDMLLFLLCETKTFGVKKRSEVLHPYAECKYFPYARCKFLLAKAKDAHEVVCPYAKSKCFPYATCKPSLTRKKVVRPYVRCKRCPYAKCMLVGFVRAACALSGVWCGVWCGVCVLCVVCA